MNNIQIGAEDADTMLALHEIYKMLARRMNLKMPAILEGFLDSKMLKSVDEKGNIFMKKDLKGDPKHKEILYKGK